MATERILFITSISKRMEHDGRVKMKDKFTFAAAVKAIKKKE